MKKGIVKFLWCFFFIIIFSFIDTLLTIKFPNYPKEFRLWYGFIGGSMFLNVMDMIDDFFKYINLL